MSLDEYNAYREPMKVGRADCLMCHGNALPCECSCTMEPPSLVARVKARVDEVAKWAADVYRGVML